MIVTVAMVIVMVMPTRNPIEVVMAAMEGGLS
jgi:hypothetical protein